MEVGLQKILANALLVCGFCLGTVGAAGFRQAEILEGEGEQAGTETREGGQESGSVAAFGVGLFLIAAGGILARQAKRSQWNGNQANASAHTGLDFFRNKMAAIYDEVGRLEEERATLASEDFRQRLDALFTGDCFDLGSRHEELASLVGFAQYAKVWDGFATGERLLSRAWSLATDGHLAEALEEIPVARKHLQRSAEAMAGLTV
ncbi:MAG: hypothetical protein DWQ01_19860 [Planctomycetota bacterium]|nr:MAG: hypothetical protein DWQ01_19860 [Planctomycetota bacterium]